MHLPRQAPIRLLKAARGAALIAVLCLIVLLTTLTAAVATLSMASRRSVERDVEVAQLELAADSAIRLTALELAFSSGATPSLSEPAQPLAILKAKIQVAVEREAERVDLNNADPDLLYALFAGNGWQLNDARTLAARIVDWRDADDRAGEGGDEHTQYAQAGLAYAPRNAPFETPDELRQVLGAASISDSMLNAVTVYTRRPKPIDATSLDVVRRALAYAQAQRLGGHDWISEGQSVTVGESDAHPSLLGEVVRIRACADISSLSRCRVAVLRLTGHGARPTLVLSWRTAF